MLYTVSSLMLAQVRSAFLRLKALWVPSIATARIVQLCAAASAGSDRGRGGVKRWGGVHGEFLGGSASVPTAGAGGTSAPPSARSPQCNGCSQRQQQPPSPTCDGGGAGGKDDAVVGGAP